MKAWALAAAVALGLTACSPLYRNHGFAPSESDLAALTLGGTTREEAIAALGRPTVTPVLGGPTLYYVKSRFRQLAFLAPQEISREVLALTFGPDGRLGAIERFGLEDGRVVPLSRRTTPGVFADSTFIRQILGNIGRFDAGTLLDGGE
jgi:outer membrane protein assembly factor BamE (lipoprotein component of BamABCDE complex)